MPREAETFRYELEQLNEKFPNKETFTYKEIADFLGRGIATINIYLKPYRTKGVGVTKVSLAKYLSDRGA
jgi:hypothetical protein